MLRTIAILSVLLACTRPPTMVQKPSTVNKELQTRVEELIIEKDNMLNSFSAERKSYEHELSEKDKENQTLRDQLSTLMETLSYLNTRMDIYEQELIEKTDKKCPTLAPEENVPIVR